MPLSIPEDGLHEVLSAWNGRGELLEALALAADEEYARDWTALDVRRRAHRVLLQQLAPMIETWPRSLQGWLEALPAETVRQRRNTVLPAAGVDWVSTRVRHGWPPRGFEVRHQERPPQTVLLTTVRWTLEWLAEISDDAGHVEKSVVERLQPQLDAAIELLDEEPLAAVVAIPPVGDDLRAISHEGRPWNLVAAVAADIRSALTSPREWARRLVMPVVELRPALFHLGVLGSLLVAVRKAGGVVTSMSPLSRGAARPAYAVVAPDGSRWDLWFEAGGVWSWYGRSSPYVAATSGLGEAASPIRPDLMLLRLDHAALVFECKYSERVGTVGRAGVTQAMAYAVEARSELAPSVQAWVVAPDGVTSPRTATTTFVGETGIIGPADIAQTLDSLWSGASTRGSRLQGL